MHLMRATALGDVLGYIEVFYSHARRRSYLDGVNSKAFERASA